MSLNWPALAPSQFGRPGLDASSVSYYRKLLETAKAEGLTTFVTLFHFCLPAWLAAVGGWRSHRTVDAFAEYAELAARELGHLVDYWLTVNEPLVYAYQGYVPGTWPPGYRKSYVQAFRAVRGMLEGHARAYHAIRSVLPAAQISYTTHWRPFEARRKWNPFDQVARHLRDQVFNHLFPRAVDQGELRFPYPLCNDSGIQEISGPIATLKGTADFLGINYYTREICEFRPEWPIDFFGAASGTNHPHTNELGWEIYPDGLYFLLTEDVAPYRLNPDRTTRPVFITENGFASVYDAQLDGGDWSLDDDDRIKYLVEHVRAVHQAIAQGVNVKGYFYWSLTDNFEWSDGLQCRFGLVRVAYPTQQRTARKSALVYARIAGGNSLIE